MSCVGTVGKVPRETNIYQYSLNDPINFIDPAGKSPLIVIGGIVAIGAGIVFYYGWDAYINSPEINLRNQLFPLKQEGGQCPIPSQPRQSVPKPTAPMLPINPISDSPWAPGPINS